MKKKLEQLLIMNYYKKNSMICKQFMTEYYDQLNIQKINKILQNYFIIGVFINLYSF